MTQEWTPPQREAITTEADNVLAVAGPGSGKTATLVARIKHLLDRGLDPSEIVVLTFTNAAANELARRLEVAGYGESGMKIVGRWIEKDGKRYLTSPPELGFVGTLHAFALRMLKEHGAAFGYGDRVALISPEAAEDLLLSKAKTLGCKATVHLLREIKAKGRPAARFTVNLPEVVVSSYLDDMKAAGIVDYDILLDEFRTLLKSQFDRGAAAQAEIHARFSHLFVDEVQDSAPIDWDIFRALPLRRKFFVGDPDQAIYSFRGGRVAEMIAHGQDSKTRVVALEANFRSRQEICEAANRLIERNTARFKTRTESVSGDGGTVKVWDPAPNEGTEIALVANRIKETLVGVSGPFSIAVLARTNAIADGFRKALPALGVGVSQQTRANLPADWPLARSFLELLVDPDNDALAFFHLIAREERDGADPKRARERAHFARRLAAEKGTTINAERLLLSRVERPQSALEALAGAGVSRESRAIAAEKFRELPPGATMLDFSVALAEVREFVKEEEGDGVRVLTIHGAKGREFDVVFLVGFEDEIIPGRAARAGEEAIEEERRLAYVGLTRARSSVYVSSAAVRSSEWGGARPMTPSRFIAEILPKSMLSVTGE